MSAISKEELTKVIADFLELGHVENIVAMFKKDKTLYGLTGDLIKDERFAVRLGVAVLYEDLATIRPDDICLALPSLLPLLQSANPTIRGEAANILGIINLPEAISHLKPLQNDPDPQVAEIVQDIIGGQ